MSGQQTQPQQPQLLDPDTAYALVHHKVYSPVFFSKLAQDYGINPGSEQEAMEMLTMAAQLREAHDQGEVKQASAGNSILGMAHEHLNNALASEGFDVAHPDDGLVEKAAAEVALDPEIAHAVLSLQAGAASAMAAQA
jgi:hypothetical protein